MRKWEDIVKDKMEEPEGALPESVFAEFRARRDAAAAAPSKTRFPLVWAVLPAVAAGLAAVLLLRGPGVPEDDIQIIRQPSAPVAAVTDTTSVDEPGQTSPLIAQAVTPKVVRLSVVKPQEVDKVENVEPAEEDTPASFEDKDAQSDVPRTDVNDSMDEEASDSPITTTTSPFIPENAKTAPVTMKVGPASGMIAGGGLLAAVTSAVFSADTKPEIIPISDSENPHGFTAQKDKPTGASTHCFPFKMGVTARIPIRGKLYVTTGLEYSLYQSSFIYSVSGEKRQTVQYLGIPLRLDWLIASGKLLDVYAGGGFQGDFCVGAGFDGAGIQKDRPSLSIIGVGGIQMNMTKHLGLYVEPELGWRIPSGENVLQTYRSQHPLMFSVTAGLRINLDK